MPELPEVETIRRELREVLPGRRLVDIRIGLPKIVKLPERKFVSTIKRAKILDVRRRAKLVLIDLANGWTIVIHLKMSGQLIWQPVRGQLRVGGHPIPGGLDDLPNKYSHVIFRTDRGTLFFNDQRQFGFVKLFRTADLNDWLIAQGYGPEPLEDSFRLDDFLGLLRRHRMKRVKPTLIDQTVLAGVGNIYADEACHFAKVRPTRRIMTMTKREQSALYYGLRHVMNLSLKHRGTSAYTYRRVSGEKGAMESFLRVYGRSGERCKRCGGTIQKTVLAGRGTHFCPSCQR